MTCSSDRNWLGVAVTLGLTWCHLAAADISLAPVTWGSGGDTLGWTGQGGDASSVTSPATGGNSGGFLAIKFDAVPPTEFQTDAVANSGPGYTGDYRNSSGLTFDLLGYSSSSVKLFFVSGADSSTWFWDLESPVADQVWQSYSVDFQRQGPGGWNSASPDFLTALSQVDSIGLVFFHQGTDQPMQYGLDNWQMLFVPEPEATAMAAILALSALAWLRRTHLARRS